MIELECKDCKGSIIFNNVGSGSAAEAPSVSRCRCVDRDTHKNKKISNVEYVYVADFKPDYMSEYITNND